MATIYPRGQAWYLQWSEGGRQRRESLGKIPKWKAEQLRKAKELELETGEQFIYACPQFQEFAPEYLDWYAKEYPSSYPRAAQIVRDHLMPYFQYHRLDRLESRTVEAWKSERGQTVKSATVAKELHTLKAILSKAVEWDVLHKHPCKAVKDPKQLDSKPIRFYTPEEMQRIYAADPEWKWHWMFMANTGIRRSEALSARREHLVSGTLRVESTEDNRTKSAKWRQVPLSSAAQSAIEHLGAPKLYPAIYPQSLSRAFARSANKAGVGGHIHLLRHTFCSTLVMQGVPLRTVQVLAGHASFVTTEKYAHLAPDYLKGAVANLNL